MANITPKAYLHGLRTISELSLSSLNKLLVYCKNDFEKAFRTNYLGLLEAGLEPKLAKIIVAKKQQINPQTAFSKLSENNIASISYLDENYPSLLHEISQPPVLLYYKGRKIIADELAVAIVGTRKVSDYGKAVTELITKPLAQNRVTIVSGLAYGVDSIAHRTAIEAMGRTVAVVGCGLRKQDLYPQAHVPLADEIVAKGGTIISEYPPGTPALKQNFIARNRIIAGLTVATLVTECAEKSGALITARFALEQNRNVYAVPGSIFNSGTQGPNNLIKLGAKPVTGADDIFDDLRLKYKFQNSEADFTEIEQKILQLISQKSHTAQELIGLTRLQTNALTAALTTLELKGEVINLGASGYIQTKK